MRISDQCRFLNTNTRTYTHTHTLSKGDILCAFRSVFLLKDKWWKMTEDGHFAFATVQENSPQNRNKFLRQRDKYFEKAVAFLHYINLKIMVTLFHLS